MRRFVDLCASCSMPGYGMAAFEALGFISRNLYPDSLVAIDHHLHRSAAGYFWHGVGRGLYFSPTRALPGLTASALDEARRAPDAVARRNAVAGVAWALTLVNIRHPGVLAGVLAHPCRRLSAPEIEAFANGVGAALAIWNDATSESENLPEIPRLLPTSAARKICIETSRRYRWLQRNGRIEKLFCCPG